MISRPPQITESHLSRPVAVYARQSSPAQVRENVGSTAIQRDGVNIVKAFGWPDELIEVRDGDLGCSAAEPGSREDFPRLIEDMWAWKLGGVWVADNNRINRNDEDYGRFAHAAWRRDVVLIVGTQVFDFKDPNSAFIAGVLGLNAVRDNRVRAQVGQAAKREKAAKGRGPSAPPVGLVRIPGAGWDKHGDDRVREMIQLVFDKFLEIRSGRGLVRYLRRNRIQLPRRARGGGIRWADATWNSVALILKNPAYAGIYIYGKRAVDYSREPYRSGQRRSVACPPERWIVIKNHHPAYIEPHRGTEIQEILNKNRRVLGGPPGRGNALVQGLLVCTVHGVKFETRYPDRERLPDGSKRRGGKYQCVPTAKACESKVCCTIRSRRLDAVIEAELFKTLKPPSLDLIREAGREAQRQYEALCRAREDELRRKERRAAEVARRLAGTFSGTPGVSAVDDRRGSP